ncbi:MAG: T9SS type A sorting domain-containing protein [Bacteroidota bacterium]
MKQFCLPVNQCLRIFLLSFFLAFTYSHNLYATHTMGADITYSCLGGSQYQVKLTLFRDCAGILPLTSQSLQYSSASCGVSSFITLTQNPSVVDVTPLCPSATSACSGGAILFGIEQYTFTGILNLPANSCNDWELGWSNCCRNNAITTLNFPGNQSTYISASLDNTLNPCNSSPVFTHIPTPIVCINQPVIYNHGVTDPDGDSLAFSLVDCFQDPSTPVSYATGFSNTTPLATAAGVTIDSNTGEINFTPNQIQIGVICVQVDEYRSGVKIGETVRDMQFSVISCTNTPPVASGVNGNATDYDLDLCVGGNVCFDILISDLDLDNVTASWNSGIPGGTFTVANNGTQTPTATFCWQPTAADVGSHFFTVTVEDDNCPLSGSGTYAFTVNVSSSFNSLNVIPVHNICNGQSAFLTANGFGATGYTWTPSTGLSNPTSQFTNANPSVTTIYTVTADYASGCSVSKTVTVNVNQGPTISVNPPVSYSCPGSSVTLTTNATGATAYSWSPGGASSPNLTVSPTSTQTYTVTASDGSGCQAQASATINVSTPGSNTCDVIYVSNGASGSGTATDPTDLLTGLSMAACNDVVIKMDIGTYTIDNAIANVFDNITLEGGFDQANSWRKTSTPGATTIHRSALNPAGPANGQRIVAFELTSATNFRFQDLTITTANAPTDGTSTYGIHLNNCSNYTFARCQILPGNAANGSDGSIGTVGADGNPGADGDPGHDSDQDDPGEGGNGGDGAGTSGGLGGAGGLDLQNGLDCCSATGGIFGTGKSTCCQPGGDGDDGLDSTDPRDGGGGGGGGCGGEADNFGGAAGQGGGINGGTNQIGGGAGGPGGNPATSGNGVDGFNGAGGSSGTDGVNGANGTHTSGFWIPGAQAGTGTSGGGGKGGVGGGGGGGEGCGSCIDGAGSGGGGGGGGGQGGTGGTGGFGGGSSYAVYIYQNGTGGNFLNCNLNAGSAGTGGVGGVGGLGGSGGLGGDGDPFTGGSSVGAGGDGGNGGNGGAGGDGGDGASGEATALHVQSGTALATSDVSFNLASLPEIQMDNVSCTNSDVFFYAFSSNVWDFGTGATPPTFTGTTVDCQYSSTGRRTIDFGANSYVGFANIIVDNASVIPNMSTSAPQVLGQYTICAGTAVDFASLNGGSGYVYNWDMGGGAVPNTYSGITYETLSNITFNTPGIYTIELRYSSDCCGLTSPSTIILNVEEQPNLLVAGPNTFCAGTGGVDLTASGGNSYLWSPSLGLSATTGSNVTANPTATTSYAITAYSSGGNCIDQTTVSVTVNDLTVSGFSTDAGCNDDGTASTVPGGGSGTYIYSWGGGQTSPGITGLGSGTYSVVVTDAVTGCVDSTSIVVGQVANTLDSYISNTSAVSCNGVSDGTATVTTTGTVVGTLTYQWTPSGGTGATTTPLAAGTYTVDISDSGNGCTTSSTVSIPEPAPITIDLVNSVNPDCNTFGQIVTNASGGTGPYSYSWNTTPVQVGNTATNLTPGSYIVTVVDDDGCSNTRTVVLPGTQSPVVLSLVSAIDATNCSTADGSITVSGTGSGGNITYTWATTPVQTGTFISGLFPGFYTVTATGSNGCTDNLGINVGPNCPLPVEYTFFEATAQKDHIALEWETEVERQNLGFFLERRHGLMEFEDIVWIPSKADDQTGASYQYFDTQLVPGERYFYRLRQKDLNGMTAHSKVEEAQLEALSGLHVLKVYPVPSKDVVYIEIYTEEAAQLEFLLFNNLGQQVSTKFFDLSKGVTNLSVNIESLASGVYMARLNADGRYTEEVRLIKTR